MAGGERNGEGNGGGTPNRWVYFVNKRFGGGGPGGYKVLVVVGLAVEVEIGVIEN